MATVDSVIKDIFDDNCFTSSRSYSRSSFPQIPITPKKYMEIPIGADTFELPILAFSAFRRSLLRGYNTDMLVACLYSCGRMSEYRSLDAILKEVMCGNFYNKLYKIEVPNSQKVYYGTMGAIFDKNLNPMMMMSWIFEKKLNSFGVMKYHYKRPVLRINPEAFVKKEDNIQKFLIGRLLSSAVAMTILTPYFSDCNPYFEQVPRYSDRQSFKMQIMIDECPFMIKEPDKPSISVTNEKLLDLVETYLDEMQT